jgi:cytochrome c nitrite reductase small subunit
VKKRQDNPAACAASALPVFLLCCLVGVLLGAGGFTFREGEGLSYLGDESATCANCHIMREHFDGWQKSSHHAWATCNGCHVPQSVLPKYWVKAMNGFHHSKAFTLQNFHEPIRIQAASARVVQANCVRCHGELVEAMLTRAYDAGTPFACARCHSGVGHGPTR